MRSRTGLHNSDIREHGSPRPQRRLVAFQAALFCLMLSKQYGVFQNAILVARYASLL
jgi:hypothetical protein